MKQFRFLNWKVYSDAQDIFSSVILIVKKLPTSARFDVGNQIIRSALSVPLNIAEGSGKHSAKEFNRFIEIALGSAYETVACLDTLNRNGFLDKNQFLSLVIKIEEICKQLGGLQKSIKKLKAL